ncbi:Multidrug transporter of the major facilitator superfamily [Komagataella phaffii CBS 7435]|uniref:Multidrug transporter of the major facilitator superfamily n=2 Tax=Komagataella phaffii TaxID=460519 RepID=C4QXD4_KOMPG|nr:Multidrug transporter of the major facilitator superfamily [Komagataella phaffii GS115]AOA61834.1 GQ67_02109T0 [Komagataella phaffii]CAH2446720.1 Multidrug transporter of the major facilitator superfamily [Komagataella phaffii CBS 7435]AOA65373.1 GQ68_02124T0 [Komagataella phaffii GS115]CAY67907.1 Multidrug transporter of the major facilitator superfamily [Komagataella phaffii GS115]CCA36986.1 Multidrug transporter of the major facilitator superfamily [Komagataella phaffii CBS 7435]
MSSASKLKPQKSPNLPTDDESISSSMNNDQSESNRQLDVVSLTKEASSSSNKRVLEKSTSSYSQTPDQTKRRWTYEPQKTVPRDRRRNLGWVTLIPEYKNPREYDEATKYTIILVVALSAVIGPMGTSILLPVIDEVAADLGTSVTLVNISVGIYLLSLGVLPLWWSSFSERLGRRPIYISSFALFFAFSIGCSLSKSIGMLIGFRVLCGGCSASVQSIGAGTIADLYPPLMRGSRMGLFYLGPLAGPLMAPIIGGALGQGLGWRSTQWFLVIFSACLFILQFFLLPETMRAQDSPEAIRALLKSRQLQNNLENKGDDRNSSQHKASDVEPELETAIEYEETDALLQRIATLASHYDDEVGEESMGQVDRESPAVFDPVMPALSKMETDHRGRVAFLRRRRNRIHERLAHEFQKLLQNKGNNTHVPENLNESRLRVVKRNLYIYLVLPIKSLCFLQYPPVLLSIIYSAPCFAVLYFVNMTLTYCYARSPYNFSPILIGLVYIPNSVTYFIASTVGGRWADVLLKKYKEKHGVLAPEARFGINITIASILFPCALLITGWCLDKKVHWVAPLVGTAIFGFAQMIVIGVNTTYIVDSLPGRGATGIAVNNFVRMILASVASFVTEPLINAIGVGPLFSILAGITLLLISVLIVLKKKGHHWRETYDLERIYDKLDDVN